MTDPDRTRTAEKIQQFIARAGWLESVDGVTFLAAGEYNENYIVYSRRKPFVFRINHGSQLGQADQIGYEFRVLTALAESGVTPLPYAVERTSAEFPRGALLMEYLPGEPLDYVRDRDKAAYIFSRVHSCPLTNDLLIQQNPVADIASESYALVYRYPDHPMEYERKVILNYHDHIVELGDKYADAFREEPLCIVNTEVNSGNFLIRDDSWKLVDWEKAVVSSRYQDLGHFLVPTTTLWKSNYTFDPEARGAFLRAYAAELSSPPPFDTLDRLTSVLERTILLRALSWCHMAYYEYTTSDRALKNEVTFSTITGYLKEIDRFLAHE